MSPPRLDTRVLPLLDVIFLLLALFLLLPHGIFPQKNPSLKRLPLNKQKGKKMQLFSDVPFEIRILPDGQIQALWMTGLGKWRRKNFSPPFSWNQVKKWLEKAYAQANKYCKQLESAWRKHKGEKPHRPPLVAVYLYIHREASVFYPLKISQFFRHKKCLLFLRLEPMFHDSQNH